MGSRDHQAIVDGLFQVIDEAFKVGAGSPARLPFVISKGVLFLQQFTFMPGTERKELLLSVLKRVASSTDNLALTVFIDEVAPALIDSFVSLGKRFKDAVKTRCSDKCSCL